MVFRPELDVSLRPLHSCSRLDALSQANLSFELLSLCLQGDGHTTLEDHIDLIELIIIIGISSLMFSTSRLMCRWFLWHLLAIHKGSALLQIMP
jgi:hypothetical protein